MKKNIAAFDGLKYSTATRDCALYLAKHTNMHLVGVFLDDPTYSSYKIYELVDNSGIAIAEMKKMDAKDHATRAASSEDFEKHCQQHKLEYSVHHDKNIAITDLKHESIYADMLIVNMFETLTHYTESPPTRFIRELLEDVHCTVLLAPQNFQSIDKIVLLYDGDPSSVHAIKMFSYLLPQLKHLPVEVVSVKPYGESLHVPDNTLMKELMKRHFPKAVYTVLKGSADIEIINHLKKASPATLVVLDAYRRGFISRWFKESIADAIMKKLKLPLFIAHTK